MRALLSILLVLLLAPVAAGAASPRIQAHRGGSVLGTEPTYPENTLPAFRHAAKIGAVVEFDVKLTKDRVPIVIHDDTLDRTTTCTGPVKDRTLRQIQRRCKADVLGSPGGALRSRRIRDPRRRVTVPRLWDVLRELRRRGASISLEIKNLPGDDDYDPSSAYANRIMTTVLRSGFPKRRTVIQSFLPQNLQVARQRWPGVATSYLTLRSLNGAAATIGAGIGATWLSPQWPVDRAWVTDAHARGFRVVPFTLDRRAEVRAARDAGVDALITDDPHMALRALGRRVPR